MRPEPLIAGALFALLSGCAPELNSPGGNVDSTSQAIIGGARSNDAAVVQVLIAASGQGPRQYVSGCSGTLVGNRAVITARHCVEDETAGGALYGVDQVLVYFRGTERALNWYEVNPSTDLAMLELLEQAPANPMRINWDPLEPYVGQPVRLVGYGGDGSGGDNSQQSGTSTLVSTRPNDIFGSGALRDIQPLGAVAITGGQSSAGAKQCQGDSGGPAFMTIGGSEALVGVFSQFAGPNGSIQGCNAANSYNVQVRTDANSEWIDQFITNRGGGYGSTAPQSFGGCAAAAGGTTSAWLLALLTMIVGGRRRARREVKFP